MAFGSAWLQVCPPSSVGEDSDKWIRLPQTKWKTWLRIGKALLPQWDIEVVGLIHCRSRSHASFMMPREHRGKPGTERPDEFKPVLSLSTLILFLNTFYSVNYSVLISVWKKTTAGVIFLADKKKEEEEENFQWEPHFKMFFYLLSHLFKATVCSIGNTA